MLSQTNVHWLAINKLDLVTAHNRCLRIISFSRLYGHVPEEELDLIQLAACKMTQTCAGAAKIMGCELLNAGPGSGIFDDFPENLWRHPVSPDSPGLIDRSEHSTGRDLR